MIKPATKSNFTTYFRQLFFTKEVMANVLVCIVWASMLLMYVRAVANRIPVLNNDIDLVEKVFVAIPTILSLPVLWKRFTLADYIFYISWVLLFALNYFAYPNNEDALMKWAFPCLCVAIPYYFIGRFLDVNKYWTIFIFLSGICIVMDILYYMTFVQSMKSAKDAAAILSEDNMYASYQLLPHVIMMFWATMRKFNILTLILGIMGFLLILSFGSRGPMACLGFFCVLYFFCFMNFKHSAYIKFGIISLVAIAAPFLVEITIVLKRFFEDFGLSTRIVDRILKGGLTHDSGRSGLRDKLYNILDNSDNFFGFGFFGSQRYGIIYAHNLFCDVFFTFGYYLGSLFLIVVAVIIALGIISARGIERQFMLFLFSVSLIKLMLSNTFVADPYFFLLIGYCFYVKGKRNNECASLQ